MTPATILGIFCALTLCCSALAVWAMVARDRYPQGDMPEWIIKAGAATIIAAVISLGAALGAWLSWLVA